MKYKSLLSLLALAGCMSADPDYYTLYVVPDSAGARASFADIHTTIKIQRPGLADLLDRPEMVRMQSPSRLERDTAHLWGEPLDKMAERVLAQDLGQRLPASSVITESGGMQADYAYRVEWELQQFGSTSEGRPQLTAQMLIAGPGENAMPEPVMLQGSRSGTGKALAQALSELLARLSDKIAAELQAKIIVQRAVPGGEETFPSSAIAPPITRAP